MEFSNSTLPPLLIPKTSKLRKNSKYWQNIGVRVDLFTVDSTKSIQRSSNPDSIMFCSMQRLLVRIRIPILALIANKGSGIKLSGFAHKKIDTLIEDARLTTDSEKTRRIYILSFKIS